MGGGGGVLVPEITSNLVLSFLTPEMGFVPMFPKIFGEHVFLNTNYDDST